MKISVKKTEKDTGFYNINRGDAKAMLEQRHDIPTYGRPNDPAQKINHVLRHDYLRKSMVDRIERKSMINEYKQSLAKLTKERLDRPTKTQ